MSLNGTTLKDLVARHEPGLTLEQAFYTDPDIFEHDLECIVSRQWLFVDHVSRIPNLGDYFLYEVAGESIILVRTEDETVRAHFNVCRHRGSRVCVEAEGNRKRFTCPYHAWSYALDGSLVSARQMSETFEKEKYSLHPCRVQVFEGLIFISLSAEAGPDFNAIKANLSPFIAPHGLTRAKVAHREVYPTHANWKLVVENFLECYHCSPAHPEYTSVNAYVRTNDKEPDAFSKITAEWNARAQALGHATGILDASNVPDQPHGAERSPIKQGFVSLTKDGTPASRLMGDFQQYDGGETFVYVGPLHYGSMANDHVTLFRFTPVNPTHTEVVLTWLVDEHAKEGTDYDIDHLKWMWDVTTTQDTRIINNNQAGVNSRRYRPGPYSLREGFTAKFTRWYLSQISP